MREALLNALCHKQYESCAPIQISIYVDKLYIADCCELPLDWTVDSLMRKHTLRPYNPSIANALYLAGLIENWGRGIEKICSACKEASMPLPEYTVHSGDIMVKSTAGEETVVKASAPLVTDKVTEKESQLIQLINENPDCTMTQLADKKP